MLNLNTHCEQTMVFCGRACRLMRPKNAESRFLSKFTDGLDITCVRTDVIGEGEFLRWYQSHRAELLRNSWDFSKQVFFSSLMLRDAARSPRLGRRIPTCWFTPAEGKRLGCRKPELKARWSLKAHLFQPNNADECCDHIANTLLQESIRRRPKEKFQFYLSCGFGIIPLQVKSYLIQ